MVATEAVGVSRRASYAWRRSPSSARKLANERLSSRGTGHFAIRRRMSDALHRTLALGASSGARAVATSGMNVAEPFFVRFHGPGGSRISAVRRASSRLLELMREA